MGKIQARESQNIEYKSSWHDAWGRSYKKIREGFEGAGLPMPKIENVDGGVKVTFMRKNANNSQTTPNGNSNGEISVDIQLTDRQQDIIAYLRIDGDTTATKLAKLLGISKRTIDREFSFLRKNGFIEKETKDNRSPWVVIDR